MKRVYRGEIIKIRCYTDRSKRGRGWRVGNGGAPWPRRRKIIKNISCEQVQQQTYSRFDGAMGEWGIPNRAEGGEIKMVSVKLISCQRSQERFSGNKSTHLDTHNLLFIKCVYVCVFIVHYIKWITFLLEAVNKTRMKISKIESEAKYWPWNLCVCVLILFLLLIIRSQLNYQPSDSSFIPLVSPISIPFWYIFQVLTCLFEDEPGHSGFLFVAPQRFGPPKRRRWEKRKRATMGYKNYIPYHYLGSQ